MGKYCSILILLLIAGNTFGQEEYESKAFKKSLDKWEKEMIRETDECKNAIKKAFKDYNEGKGIFYSMGDLSSWDVVYDKHMEDKLKIEVKSTGCSPDLHEECYNIYAEFIITQMYGDKIHEKLKNGTDSLFRIGKGIEDPKYVGGKDKLYSDINNLKKIPSSFESDKTDKQNPIDVNVRFEVDTIGNIENPKIYLVRNSENKEWYENEAIRIVNNLENWIPAIRFGEKINSYKFVSITFGERPPKKRRLFRRRKNKN